MNKTIDKYIIWNLYFMKIKFDSSVMKLVFEFY